MSAIKYTYDGADRLIREDNKQLGTSTAYEYDMNGNIICKRQGAYTTAAEILNAQEVRYGYEYLRNELLTYNGERCVYDKVGNPTTYRGKRAEWGKGRQLNKYNGVTFEYDGKGKRTKKNDISFVYDSQGNLISQSNGLEYLYDATGLLGVKYSGNTYIYRKDIQGNIIALLDSNGAVVVEYVYDAWGNHAVLDANGRDITSPTHIGTLNPYRYRGYYYDTETGMYYLQTRYYDPEICRFMTIDGIEYVTEDPTYGHNLYAYCANNPVMYVDPTGHILISTIVLLCIIGGAVIGAAVGGTVKGVQAAQNGASGWEVFGQVMLGIGVGACFGGLIGLGIGAGGAGIGFALSGGAFALAGGGMAGFGAAVAVGVGSVAVGGAITRWGAIEFGEFIGSNIMFSKDPYVKNLEKGMTEYQKEMFQREIEDYKKHEGRGGADNLPKKLLKEIAELVKKWYWGE